MKLIKRYILMLAMIEKSAKNGIICAQPFASLKKKKIRICNCVRFYVYYQSYNYCAYEINKCNNRKYFKISLKSCFYYLKMNYMRSNHDQSLFRLFYYFFLSSWICLLLCTLVSFITPLVVSLLAVSLCHFHLHYHHHHYHYHLIYCTLITDWSVTVHISATSNFSL